MKVLVIGGGASGMMAAIKAAECHDVTLMDSNDKLGKKLLLTGNGKCNYWHDYLNADNYITDDDAKLNNILMNDNEVFDFLKAIGLYPYNKDGYIYPRSKDANSVHTILTNRLKTVNILFNHKCNAITKKDNKFVVSTSNGKEEFDKVIVACGGMSYPKTGSDGSMYDILKRMGHNVETLLPGLCFLKCNGSMFNKVNGVRSDGKASLYIDGNLVKEEAGEIQFTSEGLSGICIFNLSLLASKALNEEKNVKIHLNLMPNETFDSIMTRCAGTVENLLESLINYKLVDSILNKVGISKSAYFSSLTDKEKKELEKNLYDLTFNVIGTGDFNKSQVTLGGIPFKEVNENFESNTIPGLYIVGETLNVTGICGG